MSSRELPNHRIGSWLLGICMFTTGGAGLVTEYVLATTTTYMLGNSIEQFSVIIALMMLMMGIAGFTQKQMSDENLIEKFVTVEVLMAIIGGFSPVLLFTIYGSMTDHFNIALYFIVSAVGFLIGFEIPLVMRIIEQRGVNLKNNLVLVYAMDYVGAFVGAILWVKVLLKYLPLTEISFVVSGTNFLIAVITMLYFCRQKLIAKSRLVLTAALCTSVVLGYGYAHNRDWSMRLEQRLYDDPIVGQRTTRYQHFVVTHNPRLNDTRLYINGNTQFSSLDEARYHENLVHPVMSLVPGHANALILGGGDGLALREIFKYQTVESVDLVDLDPEMIDLASTHPYLRELNGNAFADARVKTLHSKGVSSDGFKSVYEDTGQYTKTGEPEVEKVADVQIMNVDADRFVGSVARNYNVVIIDLPDPNSVEINKLYTREFYAKVKKRLARHGMVAVQATSPYHAKEAFLEIGMTLRSAGFHVLPYHDNVPSFGEWGWYLAWKSDEPVKKMKRRIRDMDSFAVETQYLNPERFRANCVFGNNELQTGSQLAVNTMLRPTLYRTYQEESWLSY